LTGLVDACVMRVRLCWLLRVELSGASIRNRNFSRSESALPRVPMVQLGTWVALPLRMYARELLLLPRKVVLPP